MSDLSVIPGIDQIQNKDGDGGWGTHSLTVLSRTSFLCNSPEMSDIKFIFKGEDGTKETVTVIYGHKLILAMGSPVFHKMFFTQNQQFVTTVQEEVDMKDHSFTAGPFLAFVKFLYTDKINYEEGEGESMNLMCGILSCADYYDIPFLKKDCVKHIEKIINKRNAIAIMETAKLFMELDLAQTALEFIDQNPTAIFVCEETLCVKLETLFEIFKRDSLGIDESLVLDFALTWAEYKCKSERSNLTAENMRNVLGQVFFEIRFGLLTSARISELVSYGFLTRDESLDILLDVHSGGSKFKKIAPGISFKSNPRIVGQKVRLTEIKTGENVDN